MQYSGGPDSPDVTGVDGLHIEVKWVERLNLRDAYRQSSDDAADGEVPIVAHRKNGAEWLVTLSAEDFLRLYAKIAK